MIIDVMGCPLCNSPRSIPHATVLGKPQMVAKTPMGDFPAHITVTYRECVDCGMIFQTPRMDDESLSRYYSEGHYRAWVGMSTEVMDKDEQERALSVVVTIDQLLNMKDVVVSSHLDVGCSRGYLLRATQTRGMKVQGVDLNPDYIEDKSIPVVSEIRDTRKQFDLVTSIHTLEHVTNPLEELTRYWEVTAKDGWLIIEVPSNNSPGGPLRLAHLLHFQPNVLLKAIKAAGFSIVSYMLTPHQRVVARKIIT